MTVHERSDQTKSTNLGKWAAWYQDLEAPWAYGDPTSYEIGAAWLAGCPLVEDWGCGAGWLRTVIPPERYRGLDGSASPFCDVVVDLVTYCSRVPGVFLRHVLEHNDAWARILDNALASFTDRMVLILFTPERAVTEVIACHPEVGVPDIAFRLADLTDRFPPDVTYAVHRISSATQYGGETILFLERRPERMRLGAAG